MPALLIFLLKVNTALLLFCAGYYLVLRHLTFYTLNRVYLVTAILFATVYPQINLSDFAQRHQELTRPVQAVVFNWQRPAQIFIKPITGPNYWYWVELAFWAGAAFLAGRLLMQLFSLYKLYRHSKPTRIYGHDVRVIDGMAGPFSFWRSIYVNPANHAPADLKAILLHEQVHVNEWHTLDILLAELSTIFYWFNPGIWLMKKAVRENIEFITDQKILNKGVDSKQYQYSLVSVSFASSSNTIVNHFNISTIKKRIIMMNAKKSSKYNLTRYVFLVPAVVVLLLVFSISKAALISKKASSYKAIVAAMRMGGLTGDSNPNTTAVASKRPGKNVPVLTAGFMNILPQLPVEKMTDTIKKGGVFISTPERSDSLNYVINGVKVTKAEFKALDSDKIYAVEFMSPEQAGKVLDNLNNGHSTLFVTTSDSEEGKKFKEKIDKLNNNEFMLAGKAMTLKSYSAMGGGNISWSSGAGNSYGMGRAKKITTVNGAVLVTDSGDYAPVALQYTPSPDSALAYTVTGSGSNNTVAIAPLNGKPITVMGYKSSGKMKTAPFAVYSYKLNNNTETNINHLSAKMIMIDDKEATEKDLKKLSAADIENVNVQWGDEIIKKYGDKAKNGIVFITTKKALK